MRGKVAFFNIYEASDESHSDRRGRREGRGRTGARVEKENWANKVNSLNKSHFSVVRKGLCAETPPMWCRTASWKTKGEEKIQFLNKKKNDQKRRRVSQAVWITASSSSSLNLVPNGLAVGRRRCLSYLALPMTTEQLYKTLHKAFS